VTPLRVEEISLFCEDKEGGLSQRILDAAISALRRDLPFAAVVRAIGVHNKNDVVTRAKFARAQRGPFLRVFALRDRDFLTQNLVAEARERVFAKAPQDVRAWPLPRHSIESYRPRGGLLGRLGERARRTPPRALVADVRELLEQVPAAWRRIDG